MPKINHIALYCLDLEKMKVFYTQYFKANFNNKYVNEKKGFESYFLEFEDQCKLELMTKKDVLHGPQGHEILGYSHLAISVGSKEAVENLTNILKKDGYEIFREPRTTGDGYYESVVLDPENNRIEITV